MNDPQTLAALPTNPVAKDVEIPLSKDQIKEMVFEIVKSFEGDSKNQKDLRLYAELEMLASFIKNAKSEISSVNANEISSDQIPNAHDELEAVIGATEKAAGSILEAAEAIQDLASKFDPDVEEKVVNEVTNIFEACNFQDLAGQRLTKVVKTLMRIDNKINAMLVAFGDASADESKAKMAFMTDEEKREEELILHGPQIEGKGIDQSSIDDLFD